MRVSQAPLPMFHTEADTHRNVQIYQEREIERGGEIGCGVVVCVYDREGERLNFISKHQWPHEKKWNCFLHIRN